MFLQLFRCLCDERQKEANQALSGGEASRWSKTSRTGTIAVVRDDDDAGSLGGGNEARSAVRVAGAMSNRQLAMERRKGQARVLEVLEVNNGAVVRREGEEWAR